VEDRVLDRWFALEMGNFHRGFVSAPRPLADLAREAHPVARNRAGDEHVFDRAVLQRFFDALSPLDRRRLRLPVTVVVDKDHAGDAAIQDEVVFRLLRALGDIPPEREMREGKLWLSHVQAQALARRHPGAFQFLYA
jgi:uncharacterized protein (UPF0216 family)